MREDFEERRAHRRTSAAQALFLGAELELADGQILAARLMDSSAGGVRLELEAAPRFALGARVVLRLKQPGVSRALLASAQVCRQEERGVGLRFTERERFHALLPPELWARFDRRRFDRACLDGPVTLTSDGRSWTTKGHDISVGGVGLIVTPTEAEQLSGLEVVALVGSLKEDSFESTCVQVHRTPVGEDVRIGVQHYDSLTRDLATQRRRIARHVDAASQALRN